MAYCWLHFFSTWKTEGWFSHGDTELLSFVEYKAVTAPPEPAPLYFEDQQLRRNMGSFDFIQTLRFSYH